MSEQPEFLREEGEKLRRTFGMIEDLLSKDELSTYECIALGTLLQNCYSGIERILRYRLNAKGVRLSRTESWHKDLLIRSREEGLLSTSEFEGFLEMLLFRHLHVHGYGFALDEARLRPLAGPVPGLCSAFLDRGL